MRSFMVVVPNGQHRRRLTEMNKGTSGGNPPPQGWPCRLEQRNIADMNVADSDNTGASADNPSVHCVQLNFNNVPSDAKRQQKFDPLAPRPLKASVNGE